MNPSYLTGLSPIVALSVGVAVTSSLETNIVERLAWLDVVLYTVDLRVSLESPVILSICKDTNVHRTPISGKWLPRSWTFSPSAWRRCTWRLRRVTRMTRLSVVLRRCRVVLVSCVVSFFRFTSVIYSIDMVCYEHDWDETWIWLVFRLDSDCHIQLDPDKIQDGGPLHPVLSNHSSNELALTPGPNSSRAFSSSPASKVP